MDQKLLVPVKKLKEAMLRDLSKNPENMDEPYLSIALYTTDPAEKTSWTRRELAEEIKNNTDFAAKMMVTLINLTASMLQRGKV